MDLVYLMQKEMFRRRYSHKTIKAYSLCLRRFIKYCKKEPRQFNRSDIKEYLHHLSDNNKSASTMNLYLMAIKFALEEILNKRWYFIKLPYSKVAEKKPVTLTKEEVLILFDAIYNPTQKLMIMLMYSAGLRVSELVKLKVKDLDFEHNLGWVRAGKGNKDRLFIIANSVKSELISHVNAFEQNSWVFKGRKGHYTIRSVQVIINEASKKAKLNKSVHPHTLRHSFATHLIENGYDVATVQSLLGHNSSETTMTYVHIASPKMINVKSPLD